MKRGRNNLNRHNAGFSLAEGLLASAILAVASGAMLLPFTVGAQNNVVVVDQAAAVNLGEALMEEILTRPFHDPDGDSAPGPDEGETRRLDYDNIDDYHNYIEQAGAMKDSSGRAITAASLASYSRNVTVVDYYLPGQDTSEDANFARVTVTVRQGSRTLHALTRLAGDIVDRSAAGSSSGGSNGNGNGNNGGGNDNGNGNNGGGNGNGNNGNGNGNRR